MLNVNQFLVHEGLYSHAKPRGTTSTSILNTHNEKKKEKKKKQLKIKMQLFKKLHGEIFVDWTQMCLYIFLE